MLKAILVAIARGMSLSIAQQSGRPLIEVQALTVPAWRLLQDCALSPRSVLTAADTRPANWAGLKIPTNPWTGSNKPLLATIRERSGGTAQPPDGPPLTTRQAASSETTSSSQIVRMWIGRTLVVVHSHNQPCFRAIETHLRSLNIQQ